VLNLQNKNIITANVKKMHAPVKELKSFFYYDIIFPDLKDSFSIYYDKEAFSIHLAAIINNYQLIKNDQLNAEGVIKFKQQYSQQLLADKIDAMKNYLNETRNYHLQVKRDSTKPVFIINERSIMQDSVIIGYFNISNLPVNFENAAKQNPLARTESIINPKQNIEIRLPGGNLVEQRYFDEYFSSMQKKDPGYNLFQKSKPKKMSMGNLNSYLLGLVCSLVENYTL
jgi:uncharacterized protein YutD